MDNIICPFCKTENKVPDGYKDNLECQFCYEVIPFNGLTTPGNQKISSLTIAYQFKDQKLEIPLSEKIILGRSHFGSALFSEILYNDEWVISRKHCSIEFTDGKFYLKDEDSKNGTFYGPNKISCENAREIEDGAILYLGREPFVAKINYTVIAESPVEEKIEITSYRCSACGFEYKQYSKTCPNCKAYKKLDPIYT